MFTKHLTPLKIAINKIRAKRAGEAHDKALNRLADLYRKHREIFDWLEPSVKNKQKNLSMNDIASQFSDMEIYASQFELLTVIYLERILAFKRELFTWADLYTESYPAINSILITKMAATVNAFCAQMMEVMPADPKTLLDVQPTAEGVGKLASWRHLAVTIDANFDALEASVSKHYRAAIVSELADCRKTGISAVQKFRIQTEANLIYAAKKTEIEAKQIDAFNAQISTLKEEAMQAIRANNEVTARDALMRKISIEQSKSRYENEAKALLRLGAILKNILEECERLND